MKISKIPFQIDFPLKIFKDTEVNFRDVAEREKILKRSIYYYQYEKKKNDLLEERSEIYSLLGENVLELVEKKYPLLKVKSISLFGSSLFSKNPEDFDFLMITEGNKFSLDGTTINLNKNKKSLEYQVGISIKGEDNFTKGIIDPNASFPPRIQNQIIYRTSSALFRRHTPIMGLDLIDNEKTFLQNIYAQVSDLLNNSYELYYLKNDKMQLDDKKRAGKILSRIYEAISYMEVLENDLECVNLRKEIHNNIGKELPLSRSKKLFKRVLSFYERRIGRRYEA